MLMLEIQAPGSDAQFVWLGASLLVPILLSHLAGLSQEPRLCLPGLRVLSLSTKSPTPRLDNKRRDAQVAPPSLLKINRPKLKQVMQT